MLSLKTIVSSLGSSSFSSAFLSAIRAPFAGLPVAAVLLAAANSSACSASGAGGGFGEGDSGSQNSTDGGFVLIDGGKTDTGVQPTQTKLYAHTNTKLFSLDTTDLSRVTDLGAFDCIGTDITSMTDIAVDSQGKLYGVSQKAVFLDMKVGANSVACGTRVDLKTAGAFFGASIAPPGTVSATDESLVVADSKGDIYEIDRSSGASKKIGNFGNVPNAAPYPTNTRGTPWALSGDIVFLANNGNPIAFATVRDCTTAASPVCNRTDTLIQLDVSKFGPTNQVVTDKVRGLITKDANCNDPDNDSYGSMYGIAAFGQDIIGFSHANKTTGGGTAAFIVRINNTTGKACLITDVGSQTGAGFAGAGVTTVVSVIAPPK